VYKLIVVLIFAAILGFLVICCAPSGTWINTCSDGSHYTWAARDLRLAHSPGAPLYLLLGHGFTLLPGDDFWNLALLSAVSTFGSCVVLFLIARQITDEKWLWVLPPLIFASSPLVFGQSTIVETYALVTFLGLLAFYFYITKRLVWCAISVGLGLAVHHLILLVGIPILIHMWRAGNFRWRYVGIAALGLLIYIYIPLVAYKQPYLWGDQNWWNYFLRTFSGGGGLAGGIAVWDIPARLPHAIGVLGILIVFIPVLVWGNFRKLWLLLALTFLPILYYVTNLAPQTVVYMVPGVAFGGILLVVRLDQWGGEGLRRAVISSVIIASGLLLLVCLCTMDIGDTLDKDLSVREFQEQLAEIPEGEILILGARLWENTTAIIYFEDNDRDVTVYSSYHYRSHPSFMKGQIEDEGYLVPEFEEIEDLQADEGNQVFIELNDLDHYYTTEVTDPKSYGCRVIYVEVNGSS
jgi:hypothetical protein